MIEEHQQDINQNQERKAMQFADSVVIDDQTILTIPYDKIFDFDTKPQRKSRWGDKPNRKNKNVHENVVFNPLEALMNRKSLLPIANAPVSSALSLISPSSLGLDITSDRQSKWGPDYEKTFNPPFLHYICPHLSSDDVEYLIRLYALDDLYQRHTGLNDFLDDPDIRSPSPEPIYDAHGRRINTREHRYKENMIREKHIIIEECLKINKSFVPPSDYKPMKKQKKIYLPEIFSSNGDNNYIGMIIGPRGSTQKQLEARSGCKISIRGKGSSKAKRVELDSDDRLHVLVQADNDDILERGVEIVEKILNGEDEDEMKKNQRLQLQVVTGVLRDDFCDICHEKGHRSWACPSKLMYAKAEVKCSLCGELSHPTIDCPKRRINMVSQFDKFMNEVEGKKERVQFITETKFTMPTLYKQIADKFHKDIDSSLPQLPQEEQIRLNQLIEKAPLYDTKIQTQNAITNGPAQMTPFEKIEKEKQEKQLEKQGQVAQNLNKQTLNPFQASVINMQEQQKVKQDLISSQKHYLKPVQPGVPMMAQAIQAIPQPQPHPQAQQAKTQSQYQQVGNQVKSSPAVLPPQFQRK